jgi:multiple inositol-polyphosphate phosphatase/2,3-bisphosphoglycerate 3-phosphatase
MTLGRIAVFLVLSIIGLRAQYTQPYDRDRNEPYDRQNQQYDRQNQYDRPNQSYDRGNPQYGQNYDRQNPSHGQYDRNNPPPYDRDRQYNSQYNQSQYGRQNQSQYGPQGPPYDNRDQYNRNRDPYDNRNQYHVTNHDQYGNRDQYDRNRDQYGTNRDQYGGNRDQYGGNRDQYGGNRDQNGGNRDQYGGNRDQYGGNRDQYGGNRDQYNRNRDQYHTGNRDDQSGPQYGTPLFDTNDDCCQDYCYAKDEQPYLNFATKTAYQIVFGKGNNQQHRVPECSPIQFWSINRHGTRYPSARSINRLRQLSRVHDEIIKNYDERRSFPDKGRLCPEDLDLFRRWRWNETVNDRNSNALTSQGIMDMKFLARRYASKFEDLMREPYSENTYSFQYTDTDRTHDSYQAYIEGLFKNNAYQVHANVFNTDRLIKPTKSCNAWIRNVEENPETLNEYMRFKHMQEYQQMVRDVFRRLGFRYSLNDSVISDMYDMCRYEKSWDLDRPSPWCMVFNKEQLKLLEYAEDLKYYYKGGYGNELNGKVGCPPLKDLYEKFEATVNSGNNNGNKVTVFFTHSITIQTFLTAMGIAKDYQPLTAENYYQQQRRKWRTSTIDPVASNLAAVLYECRGGERHRVMFFLNEVPVEYPECSVGLCNWSTVKSKLQYSAENCNMEFCDRSAAAALPRNYLIYLISVIAIFFSFRH